MVAEEEDWANRFQQGLRLDIQKFLVTQPLRTYSQVLSAARNLEQVEEENKSRVQARPLKRPFDQLIKGPSSRFGALHITSNSLLLPHWQLFADFVSCRGIIEESAEGQTDYAWLVELEIIS